MRVKRRLNESLIEEYFVVQIPIRVRFRTDSVEEEQLIYDYHDTLYEEVYDNVELKEYNSIYDYLKDMEDKILDGLNVSFIDIHHPYLNLDNFNNTPIMEGEVLFDVDVDEPVNKSQAKRIFNTLLNNNVINQEFTIILQNEHYGEFYVMIEVEKTSDVEIGED